ncbi:hypothetical protein [Micromonospora sp. NPDC005707]|uniref:hypothetical protein n=1 Tax=Micromonospora sp. NPDC005707 TaxID=3157050 RepID=UPI0033DBB4CA
MENEAPAPAARLKEHSGVAANVVSAVAGLVALVQAIRSDPLWIVLGLVALAALVAYQGWRRRWRAAGLAAVALLVLGVAGWGLHQDGREATPAAGPTTPAGTTTTLPAPATTAAATPAGAPNGSTPGGGTGAPAGTPAAVVFSDVVQLDQKTGVDVDEGRAVKRYAQDATVDLYLDWGYILYSSARHSALYDDTYAGPEEGADARCATYREARRTSAPHHYVGSGQQFCFTTSDGHPGWLQVVNQAGDGGAVIKLTVWRD